MLGIGMRQRLESHLAAERQARGWSQEKLARLAGITRQSYAAIESGGAVPSTDVALRLARALGLGVERLFRLPDAPPAELETPAAGGPFPPGSRVRIARVAGRALAFPLQGHSPRGVETADGVAVAVDAGQARVRLFDERPAEPSLVVLGCDPAFAVVAEALASERGEAVFWLPRGSRAALEALARGEAHLAGVHLYDPGSGTYNEPWIRRLVPFPCTRIRFAVWQQALVVRAGNPLGIRGPADLARPGLRFLNRDAGSGSRVLLDDRLHAAGVPGEAIPGYLETAASTHMAVAEAVTSGLADAGVAIQAAAQAYGLGTVPLAQESYELVIPDHFLDLPAVQALLDQLRRPGVRAQIEALGGYDAAAIGTPV
jgi:putative molybdopterin biosynthesis protein